VVRQPEPAHRSAIRREASVEQLFIEVVDRQRVRSVYQPIIDLKTNEVAAFEALARGPAGTPLESPAMLFGTGRKLGLLNELEWACRAAALQGALDANLGTQMSLFINVEPSVVGGVIPAKVEALFRKAERKLRIVLELTERDLTRRPADLLRLVAWARERYWGVALDDVGAEPESLALLPFVEPDVVKLDMKLIQGELTRDERAVVDAVQLYAKRTGANVLAEGIETDEHLERAFELGANLGQGWRFGKPSSLDGVLVTRSAVRLLPPPQRIEARSGFDILANRYEPKRITGGELVDQTDRLERLALEQDPAPVVLASFGSAGRYVSRAGAYAVLAERCPLVGVLATGTSGVPRSNVRYSTLDERDPLAREWVVAVVGSAVSEVVAARGLGPDPDAVGDDIEVIGSSDRDAVMAVAQLLIHHVVPAMGRLR
jgi:EAL domain-containing protein (putative c-di-GMP-specific phosphodiesterase class I)